jgi:hypothetical protein
MIDDCALPFNARKAFRQKPLTLGKTARCLFLVHARTIKRMIHIAMHRATSG